jgi:hypothetical protein
MSYIVPWFSGRAAGRQAVSCNTCPECWPWLGVTAYKLMCSFGVGDAPPVPCNKGSALRYRVLATVRDPPLLQLMSAMWLRHWHIAVCLISDYKTYLRRRRTLRRQPHGRKVLCVQRDVRYGGRDSHSKLKIECTSTSSIMIQGFCHDATSEIV